METLTKILATYATAGNGIRFYTNGNNERLRIDSDGNVKLITANDTAGTFKFLTFGTNNFNRAGIKCTNAATYDGSLEFYTGNASNFAERMRIDSRGRILINTTAVLNSTEAKLQVLQDEAGHWSTRINNSTGNPFGIVINYTGTAPNNTSNDFIYLEDTAGLKFSVKSNGGVANFSGNNVNLSDRRSKKDITPHTDSEWNCVKAWEIVDYHYNDEADDLPTKIGVIAQQIQEHCPELVSVFQEQSDAVEEVLDEDGEVVTEAKPAVEERIGVNEPQMMWKVTKALQEAMTRI